MNPNADSPLVSFLIPTRWRPHLAVRCARSIVESAGEFTNYEICIRVHASDADSLNTIPQLATIRNTKVLVSPRPGAWPELSQFYDELTDIARGRWVWIFNDDVTIAGDWASSLRELPETGFIAYPCMDILDTSGYSNVTAGPFPCVPNGCWRNFDDHVHRLPGGFSLDSNLDQMLRVRAQWVPKFLSTVVIHHERQKAKLITPTDAGVAASLP